VLIRLLRRKAATAPSRLATRGALASRSIRPRVWPIVIAGIVVIGAIASFSLFYYTRSPVLTIAVSGPETGDAELVTAISKQLNRDHGSIYLKPVIKPGLAATAQAIDSGETDLAIVRRDVGMPFAGRVVVVWRRNYVVLVANPDSNIAKVADLKGKRLGVVGRREVNLPVLHTILQQYEIPPDSLTVVPLDAKEVLQAVREGQLDALLAAGSLTGESVTSVIAAMTRDNGKPVFVEITQADAIAQRNPIYESKEIVAGAFGGSPPRPEEAIDTISFLHYIVARRTLDEQTAGDLAQTLFNLRQTLARDTPNILRMEAPETEKGSAPPVHPGAAAYFDGEQKTFFDRYGDMFYFVLLVGSIVGSAIAAVAGYARSGAAEDHAKPIAELLRVARSAREAEDNSTLDRLQREVDAIFETTMTQVEKRRIDQTLLLAISLALDQTGRAIADQRLILDAKSTKGGLEYR
jgi:TRAP transporter TAXI family solute receptor